MRQENNAGHCKSCYETQCLHKAAVGGPASPAMAGPLFGRKWFRPDYNFRLCDSLFDFFEVRVYSANLPEGVKDSRCKTIMKMTPLLKTGIVINGF